MKDNFIRIKNSPVFKLKDKENRNYVKINLIEVFGFLPEEIIVEKIKRMNNTLLVRAILTPEEVKKEERRDKNGKSTKESSN